MKQREPSDNEVEWYVIPLLLLVLLLMGPLLLWLGPHLPALKRKWR